MCTMWQACNLDRPMQHKPHHSGSKGGGLGSLQQANHPNRHPTCTELGLPRLAWVGGLALGQCDHRHSHLHRKRMAMAGRHILCEPL